MTLKAQLFCSFVFFVLTVACVRAESTENNGYVSSYQELLLSPAAVRAVRPPCSGDDCENAIALVFIHGIWSSGETFKNGQFYWPSEIPQEVGGRRIDVYQIEYRTKLFAWLRKDISTLDEVVYSVFSGMQEEVLRKKYYAIGFVAHSLGGNVITSYLHTIKTELGHEARSQHAFIITLGTPTDGSDYETLGRWIKTLFLEEVQERDRLLESLQRDNTFLRMLAHWRYSEESKGKRFKCRPVNMYVGLEGAPMYTMRIVSASSALYFSGTDVEVKKFDGLDHSQLSKPPGKGDHAVYDWVDGILNTEVARLATWDSEHPRYGGRLCEDQLGRIQ